MIHFLADNCALEDLCLRLDFANLLKRIRDQLLDGSAAIYFNVLPLIEQVNGLNERAFPRVSTLLKRYSNISDYGILPEPALHLRASIDVGFRDEAIADAAVWRRIVIELANCRDHTEFRVCFGRFQDYVSQNLRKVAYRKPFDDNILLEALLERYQLRGIVNGAGPDILQRLPSLKYLMDIHNHYKASLENGAESRSGDFIDFEQIAYLDGCDYLVTNDRRLRNIVNCCGSKELEGRAIGLAKYLDYLAAGVKDLTKRAPRNMLVLHIPEP